LCPVDRKGSGDAQNLPGLYHRIEPMTDPRSRCRRRTPPPRSMEVRNDNMPQFVEIYPNPADYLTTIKLKESLPEFLTREIIVSDMNGREMSKLRITPSVRLYTLNTKSWSPASIFIVL